MAAEGEGVGLSGGGRGTPRIETDLNIFGIAYSTLITSTAANKSRKMLRICSLDQAIEDLLLKLWKLQCTEYSQSPLILWEDL